MKGEWLVLFLLGMLVLCLGGAGVYFFARRKKSAGTKASPARAQSVKAAQESSSSAPPEYQVSYAPPEFEWSGNSTGSLPVKTLTYNQYECLEDARYGFRIVGLPPTERNSPQPHKTRAHGLKTVASLTRHGFLQTDAEGGYAITDLGLHALAVCSVRY